jgi:hypothetical protein
MGFFGRSRKGPQLSDRFEWVTASARRNLAERGIETTVQHGEKPEDVTLIAADSQRYPLFSVLAKTEGMSVAEAERIIAAHIDGLVTSADWPTPAEFSAEELRVRIRTRLLSGGESRPNEPTFHYARPFSDDIIVALCIDLPETVLVISDVNIGTLALGEDELYALGQLNTDLEPIDQRFEASPGVEVIVGDSLFTASKAANLPAVIGSSPFGTLFTVPHRNMLITLPITGPETLKALEHLLGVTMRVIGDGLVPGGVISSNVHFSREGKASRVSSMDEAGAVSVHVDERLQQALEEAIGG